MGRAKFLRAGNWGTEPREVQTEYVPRTDNEETRRTMLEWLRDRTDDDAIDFEDLPGSDF